MVTHGHLAQATAIVDVVVRCGIIGARGTLRTREVIGTREAIITCGAAATCGAVSSLGSYPIRIVREAPCRATLRQGGQLSAAFPGVRYTAKNHGIRKFHGFFSTLCSLVSLSYQ